MDDVSGVVRSSGSTDLAADRSERRSRLRKAFGQNGEQRLRLAQ